MKRILNWLICAAFVLLGVLSTGMDVQASSHPDFGEEWYKDGWY